MNIPNWPGQAADGAWTQIRRSAVAGMDASAEHVVDGHRLCRRRTDRNWWGQRHALARKRLPCGRNPSESTDRFRGGGRAHSSLAAMKWSATQVKGLEHFPNLTLPGTSLCCGRLGPVWQRQSESGNCFLPCVFFSVLCILPTRCLLYVE